jgi:acyl-coenzyme A thioesterase PaaI-like protein
MLVRRQLGTPFSSSSHFLRPLLLNTANQLSVNKNALRNAQTIALSTNRTLAAIPESGYITLSAKPLRGGAHLIVINVQARISAEDPWTGTLFRTTDVTLCCFR